MSGKRTGAVGTLAGSFLCGLVLAGHAFAQAPAVTRWMDPQGRARPRHEARRDETPLRLTRQGAGWRGTAQRGGGFAGRICIVAHAGVLGGIRAGLDSFAAGLEAEGYEVLLEEYSGGGAEALRAHFAALRGSGESLAGAILVGDVPHVVYEMRQDWGWGEEYEDFPCDVFYMDLDGTWSDARSSEPFAAGKYDERGGDLDLEIWVSRLKADNLPALGSEAAILGNYFRKNRDYRANRLRPARRAALFHDDDWSGMGSDDGEYVGWLYGQDHERVVVDAENTTAANYLELFQRPFELVFVRSHGYPGGHGFYENGGSNFNWITCADYAERRPPALFYSFYVCSGCDYSQSNHLGGIAAFQTNDCGLAAWGSTKTGGTWNDSGFYRPLAEGKTLGEAFVEWFNETQAAYPDVAPQWWYGMVLLGDGTLRPSGPEPAIVEARAAGGELSLAIAVGEGETYEVRRTASLATPAWEAVGGKTAATNYRVGFADRGPAAGPAFYGVAQGDDGPSNRLRNASFEVSGTADSRARHWEADAGDGHGGSWGSALRAEWRSRQGSMEAAVCGTWSGMDNGGWWQEAEAVAGREYGVSAWFWADRSAIAWTAAVQELKLEFYDASYGLLGGSGTNLGDVAEAWTQKAARATAPAGTAWARFVVNVSGAGASGALQFDRAELTQETE